MEFRFRAGERDDPSTFLAKSSTIKSPTVISGDLRERAFGAVYWKLRDKRILDEIVAREMLHREILMEKVKREIVFDQAMEARGFTAGRLLNPVIESLVPFDSEGMTNEILWLYLFRNFPPSIWEERGQTLRRPTKENEKRPPSPLPELGIRINNQNQTSPRTTGVKRKVEETAPATCTCQRSAAIVNKTVVQNYDINRLELNGSSKNMKSLLANKRRNDPSQNWSCSLCGVSTKSEKNLQDHLQGKKHKANLRCHKSKQAIGDINGRAEFILSNASGLKSIEADSIVVLRNNRSSASHLEESLKEMKSIPYNTQDKWSVQDEEMKHDNSLPAEQKMSDHQMGSNPSDVLVKMSIQIDSTNADMKDDENPASETITSPDRLDGISNKPKKKTKLTETCDDGNGEPASEYTANVDKRATASTNAMRINIQVDGVLHKVLKVEGYLWCELCKLKFNGAAMMANHLTGTMHMAAEAKSMNRTEDSCMSKSCFRNQSL